MKIHHIGYLVRKIDRAIQEFGDLGYQVLQETVYDDYRQVQICFMEKDGYVIELVSPTTKTSVVRDLLKKSATRLIISVTRQSTLMMM